MSTVTKITTAKTTALDDARAAFHALRYQLDLSNLERGQTVWAILVALIARTNVCLLGPPGVGKSRLARQLCGAFVADYFELLMTRYTMPEELFGPIAVSGLSRDEYRRVTKGMLPEAVIVFLDEVFKSNSAIINTLLTIANEGIFHNGGVPTKVPLRMIVAASNELPAADAGLEAFTDRFVVRQYVNDLDDDESVRRVMQRNLPDVTARVTLAQLDVMRDAAAAVTMTRDAEDALLAIRRKAKQKGIVISPRRWGTAADVLRADAALRGDSSVTTAGLGMLPSLMWSTPSQIATCEEIVKEFAAAWVRIEQEINATLDEQVAAIRGVDPKADTAVRAGKLGAVIDTLSLVKKKIDKLRDESPDAKDAVVRLAKRERDVRKTATDAFRNIGGA